MSCPTLRLSTTVLLLAGAAGAQLTSSPPGYLSFEGPRRSSYLGENPEFRAQVCDGEFRGRALVVSEVGFRQESAPYASVNTGRRWSSVVLRVSECDLANMSATFAANPATTPSIVFNGAVAWPGPPAVQSVPQAWEAALAFPFTAPQLFGGNREILYDFTASGGTLANSAPWGRAPVEYYLDSYADADQVPATVQSYTGGPGCVDSGATWTQKGSLQLVATAYGPNWSVQSYRNKLLFSLQGIRTGPSATIAYGLDFSGIPPGVPFPGVTCERLFLPMSPLAQLYFGGASVSGLGTPVYPSGTPNGLVPYLPIFAGFRLWAQAAWADTGSGAMLLTNAVEATLPLLPAGPAKHRTVYASAAAAASGAGPQDSYFYNRVMRIR